VCSSDLSNLDQLMGDKAQAAPANQGQ
jgi:hypothetical protein